MALFNKLFTKFAEPYELKGRWYKISFVPNQTIVSSDLPGVVFGSDNYLTICHTDKMIIADHKIVADYVDSPSTSVFNRRTRTTVAGTYQIEMPSQSNLVSCDVYVYGIKK